MKITKSINTEYEVRADSGPWLYDVHFEDGRFEKVDVSSEMFDSIIANKFDGLTWGQLLEIEEIIKGVKEIVKSEGEQ